jgi:TRAP transporter TAXI family solute receptor
MMNYIGRFNLIFILFAFFTQHIYANDSRIIKIGTGNSHLFFYQTGLELCKKIYEKKSIPCRVFPSLGSVQNLLDLHNGKIDIALSQSDVTWLATRGKGTFKKIGPNPNLKVIYSLSDLQFVILTRLNTSIFYFKDLKDHKVNFGIKNSGLRSTIEFISNKLHLATHDFSYIASLPAPNQAKELCSGKLDAIIFIVPKQSNIITKTMQECSMRIVSFSQKEIKSLIDLPIGYNKSIIKASTYPGQHLDIMTVAIELQGVVQQ